VRALAEGAQSNSDDRNQLAARSASLPTWLNPDAIQRLAGPYEPLRAAPGLDFCATIRALLASGQGPRAAELAKASNGVTKEIALGWIELEKGRSGRAARHFSRARELAPDHPEVNAGLIASHKAALARGENVPGLSETGLDAPQRALVAGWRHAKMGSWDAVAKLDPELARIAPGEPLFELATRLRIEQRLDSERPEAAAEAQALARRLLLRLPVPRVGLLHARAAVRAEDSVAAWRSLQRLARRASTGSVAFTPLGRDLAQRVLEIGRALPDERFAELEALLVKRKREDPKRDASES
jgi:tetratricopeptide (TPR) repeat protein